MPMKNLQSTTSKKRARRTFGQKKASELYRALAEDRPDPHTELNFVNPYTLVVAVALSAQATDVGVNKATAKLFAIADTPEKMLALGEAGVSEHIKTIGLWRNKAKNVIALSKMLIDEFGGEVPQTREDSAASSGRWPQDRERRVERSFRSPHHCRRYPHLSGLRIERG